MKDRQTIQFGQSIIAPLMHDMYLNHSNDEAVAGIVSECIITIFIANITVYVCRNGMTMVLILMDRFH